MTERIGVTYLAVEGGAYHMALFYEKSDGQRLVIEASPLNNISGGGLTVPDALGEIIKEAFTPGNSNDGSPFSFIVGGERAWESAKDDGRGIETLITGDDLRAKWGAIEAAATEALALHYEYRPLEQNSNTFVTTILKDAGLPQPTRQILNSNGVPIGEYATPAYQYELHDPLANTIPPQAIGSTDFKFGDAAPNKTEIVVGDPVDIVVQWADGSISVNVDGSNVANLVDVSLAAVVSPGESIGGVSGNVVLVGTSGNDTFDGEGSGCVMLGGPGDDTFLLGYGGADWIDGGSGVNTAQFSQSDHSHTIVISSENGSTLTGEAVVAAKDEVTGNIDNLTMVQNINLNDVSNNNVLVQSIEANSLSHPLTIDLGATSTGENDIADFSQYGTAYLKATVDGGVRLYADSGFSEEVGLGVKGVNKFVLSDGDNVLDLSPGNMPSLQEIVTGNGNNSITGGTSSIDVISGWGDDILTAGSAGDILDGGEGNNQYVGGAGADTFVIGNGVDAMNSGGGYYTITNADANDRIVLRLDDTVGFGDQSYWSTGIALNGGVQAIAEGDSSNPDEVSATFSSILVQPQISSGGDGAIVDSANLDAPRPDLGFFEVFYDWDKLDSKLFIFVQAAYGNFGVEVDGFQNGQLGLNFVDAEQPLLSWFQGSGSDEKIQDSWDSFNGAMGQFISSTQLVALPSPGTPIEGEAPPATPVATRFDWLPEIDFGGSSAAASIQPAGEAAISGTISQFIQAMASYTSDGQSVSGDLSANAYAGPSDANGQNLLAVSLHG